VTDGNCASDHCITCSDEGVAMRVVEANGNGLARCIDERGESDVMIDLVGPVDIGDMLLVHAGVALTKVAESPEDFPR
jgi:hydrogenase maturation factor